MFVYVARALNVVLFVSVLLAQQCVEGKHGRRMNTLDRVGDSNAARGVGLGIPSLRRKTSLMTAACVHFIPRLLLQLQYKQLPKAATNTEWIR